MRTGAQIVSGSIKKGVSKVSKETVVLHRWESKAGNLVEKVAVIHRGE